MKIAIKRIGDRRRWTRKGSHLADHREDSRKGVRGIRLEGDMENRSAVDDFMNLFEVVASYSCSAWCLGIRRWVKDGNG